MEYKAADLNWHADAGKRLDDLAQALPPAPSLAITVFGSAPLQLLVEPAFLSEDIDLFSSWESNPLIEETVERRGWVKGRSSLYIQVCDPNAFSSTRDWPDRCVRCVRHGHAFRFVHPWDVLTSKLQRLEPKDLEAFHLVLARTGHPTEEEFLRHLQKAVDLYRPRFDEESARGDMMMNTGILWRELWKKDIDVRAAIIRPVLESIRREYDVGDPQLKTRLANLKLPDDPPRN